MLLAVLVGLAFAGSRTELAAGTTIAGVDVGGMSRGRRGAGAVGAGGGGRSALRSRSPPTARQFPLTASQLGVQADWRAAVRPRRRPGRRLRADPRLQAPARAVFGIDVAPPIECLRRGRPLQARPDRRCGRPQGRRREARAQGARHPGRRGHVGPAARPNRCRRDRRLGALARFDRGAPVALPVATAEPKVNARRPRGRRDAGAHRALRAAAAVLRRDALARAALADRPAAVAARRRQHDRLDLGRGRRDSTSSGSRRRSRASRRTRTSRSPRPGKIVIRPSAPGPSARHSRDREGDSGGGVLDRPADGEARRSGRRARSGRRRSRRRWGSRASSRSYTTTYGGTPGRLNNVQLVAQADRRHADRARRHVLVQRHDRRADGREGIPGGARDHQRRAPERARRRHLPGLDDGLQRRLRSRPADHGAHEPRALHLATTRSGATRP